MIQLSRNYTLPEKQEDDLAIKIIGVGGAGSNALDRIVLDGMERVDLIAVNTDVQSLASSVATQQVAARPHGHARARRGRRSRARLRRRKRIGERIREMLRGRG